MLTENNLVVRANNVAIHSSRDSSQTSIVVVDATRSVVTSAAIGNGVSVHVRAIYWYMFSGTETVPHFGQPFKY